VVVLCCVALCWIVHLNGSLGALLPCAGLLVTVVLSDIHLSCPKHGILTGGLLPAPCHLACCLFYCYPI
jgi:hypothetical protein